MELVRGQRSRLADLCGENLVLAVGLHADVPGAGVDFACFGLDAAGRLADERYLTFFNQPQSPCGGIRLQAPAGEAAGFAFDLARVPATIERLVLTAAVDGEATLGQLRTGHVRLLAAGRELCRFALRGGDYGRERALMLFEFYRRDGLWRVCATGQGFDGGLAALVEHFGGTVAAPAAPAPAPAPPAAPPPKPVSLSKITLEKRGEKVSLNKRDSGGRFGRLQINLNWHRSPEGGGGWFARKPKSVDLDLGCLIEMADGSKGVVQALGESWGAFEAPPYVFLDGDDRSGTVTEGENLYVNGVHFDAIRRVLVFAYIYEGVPNWAATDGVVTITAPGQPAIEVRLDQSQNHPMCAIAMIENVGGELRITKLVEYIDGGHSKMDQRFRWGLRWVAGAKD